MRLAVFTKNTTNPAYAAARLGADRTGQRLGAGIIHCVPARADDVDEQTALVDAAIADRPDAFVFVPVHFTRMLAPVQRAHDAGIPVIGYLNRIDTGRLVTFVGVDDVQLGRDVTASLARHLGGRGRIVVMQGPAGSLTSVERMRGIREQLGELPGIAVLATLDGEYQQVEGRAAMAAYFAAGHALPDAVLAANDAMALGAIEALAARGASIPVVGVNAVPDAIAAVREGSLFATADFDTQKIACIAVEAAVRHLRGERVPPEILLPSQIVDRGNFAAWDMPLEARACPVWEDVVGPA